MMVTLYDSIDYHAEYKAVRMKIADMRQVWIMQRDG